MPTRPPDPTNDPPAEPADRAEPALRRPPGPAGAPAGLAAGRVLAGLAAGRVLAGLAAGRVLAGLAAGRVLAGLAALLVAAGVLVVVQAAPEPPPPPPPAVLPLRLAADASRTFGGEPLDDAWHWAGQYQRPDCGLSQGLLAAMMLAPTFGETGATPATAPSPMTLSRWDTQRALWAFGDPATPYQQAFWHPGAGMWQFDSAGGWPFTAAGAINSSSSARQAAQTMAAGFCASPAPDAPTRMRSAWRPWYACASGRCDAIVNELFDGIFLHLRRDDGVRRLGGMEERSCTLAGVGAVACWYVDPARAQGHRGFAAPPRNGNPPTPIARPFYVVEAGGREYRYWLSTDTGYDATIVASKPVTGNARTTLIWSTVEAGAPALCDQNTQAGCRAPFGALDEAVPGSGSLTVRGWAVDPDTAAPTTVRVSVDGVARLDAVARESRPDVGAVFPAAGADHGYTLVVPDVVPGTRTACVTALDTAPPVVGHVDLGCRTVTVAGGTPFGALDGLFVGVGTVSAGGWAIDPDTDAPVRVRLELDGTAVAEAVAGAHRPDVGAAFPLHGSAHGYDLSADGVGPGRRTACLRAVGVGFGGDAVLACAAVDVPDGSPVGYYDAAVPTAGGVQVWGWALDPERAAGGRVVVTVDGVARPPVAVDGPRPDVHALVPGAGPRQGFDTAATDLAPGPHEVCVTALNVGAGADRSLGCKTVTVPDPSPFGFYDGAEAAFGRIRVMGWAVDPDTASPVTVAVTVDGGPPVALTADARRPDVAVVHRGVGTAHGLDGGVGAAAGAHQVCLVARNVGPGADRALGCRTVVVVGGDPFGSLDAVIAGPRFVHVGGWAADPDTTAAVAVVVTVDGVVGSGAVTASSRPDVAAAFPGVGLGHGVDVTVPAAPGSHQVCMRARNVGVGADATVGCRTVVVPAG